MHINKFDFNLPAGLIANSPEEPRDYAQLLVYEKASDEVSFKHFFNLPEILGENDVLVFNNSKVFPARLLFQFEGKAVEIFFLEEINGLWKAMVRPGKKFKVGDKLRFKEGLFEVRKIDSEGYRYFSVNIDGFGFRFFLEKYGVMPVPPYIKGEKFLAEDYNTVYSKKEGSVAAPTAGLHFTDQLLYRLASRDVKLEYVTLHVGLGTFLPVKTEDTRQHKMHSESYEIDYSTAQRLNRYNKEGKRIIAVGTTSARVLESNFASFSKFTPGKYSTDIFIKPGYQWKATNGLITNFHLPKSTLLMLVASFIGGEKTMQLYKMAIHRRLRFYSFGDGMMLI